ncbi:MAG TPA: 3-hydroxyacyl-CoA dehydrogenase family protein [Anaerolineales bacterium]|nr:3-hydroxyacyl-CoA dehydrogenase family protein [Anaerolineales bacterium]
MSNPEQIAVIGAGLMGHGIAQVFACNGHSVWLVDSDQEALISARERVRTNLANMAEKGIDFGASIEAILDHIHPTPDMEAACQGSDFVFEAVYEDLGLKQRIFADLDRVCPPQTALCSNTSVISITEIAEKATHRQRIVGTHFWNPPYLIPLVEVVHAAETASWCTAKTYALLARVGKHPVHVYKDVPGFVGNRLQHALWREAFAIIDEGICDPATVDEVIKNGFGLRLPVLGPVENADMVGLDLTLAIHNYILKHINADPTPSKTLQARVRASELGFKSGRGFLEWSEAEIDASRQRLVNYLVRIFSEQRAQKKGGDPQAKSQAGPPSTGLT